MAEGLADQLKQTHKRLRTRLQASGATAEQVWQDHLSDEASLRQYACSMHALATGPWREHGEGRIGWCVETIHQYFLDTSLEGGRGGGRGEEGGEGGGGQLRKLLLKDVTRQQHAMTPILEDALLPSSAEQAERTVQSFRGRKLRLLDVGSCYDPFAAYPDLLETTAIDISPAVESVHRCDFLTVPVAVGLDASELLKTRRTLTGGSSDEGTSDDGCGGASSSEGGGGGSDGCGGGAGERCGVGSGDDCGRGEGDGGSDGGSEQGGSRATILLMAEGTYDVVAFSLLLSYLPSPAQRMECCRKAHRVLVPHGILLVITADSSHQNRHVGMMKDWKRCVEAVGFHRWKYIKQQHLHCMAFRKVTREVPRVEGELEALAHLLYIPQDSHSHKDDPDFNPADGLLLPWQKTSGVHDSDTADDLSELPFSFGDD